MSDGPSAPVVSRRRAALGSFLGSSASMVVASIQALALMGLYVHEIGATTYGAWMAAGEILICIMAFDLGLPNLITQRVGAALAVDDKVAIGAYFGTGALIITVLSAFVGLALALVAPYVPAWLGLSASESTVFVQCFVISSIATSLMLVNYIFLGLARGLQQTGIVNASVLAGTIVGFALTAGMLMAGHGLWSIAIGLLARSVISLLGSIAFFLFAVDPEIRRRVRVERGVAREFHRLSPPLFASGLGYALMSNSQILLAAILIGPQAATVFGLSRRAADVARSLVDMVGFSAYGGFAHLFAAGDRGHARRVYDEIVALYLAISIALVTAYVAVNPSLVGVWVGPEMYGGTILTFLLAIGTVTGGWSYLTIVLYRSLNHHRRTAVALIIECLCRTPAMIVLTLWLGLPGLPLGAILTALIAGVWADRGLKRELPSAAPAPPSAAMRNWLVRVAVFGVGATICWRFFEPSWAFVFAMGGGVGLLAAFTLARTDPWLVRVGTPLYARIMGTET